MDLAKELMLQMKSKNEIVRYGLHAESEALVAHILENMINSSLPPLKMEKKNEKDSQKYRKIGDQNFVAGDDLNAIENYTKSLAYGNSKELKAYAHANRSAALYRKELYRECLIDVTIALELGYPADKRKKLEERGAKALEKLKESMNNNIELGEDGKLDVEVDLKEKIKTIKPRYLLNPDVMRMAHGESDEAPALSSGVSISFNQQFGRHLVAERKFSPGEIISIEKPFSWIIYRDKFYTHCHYCLERCYCLIPCSNCPVSQYCSEKCKILSWNLSHKIECPIYSILVNLLNVDDNKFKVLMKIMRCLILSTSNGKRIKQLKEELKIAEENQDNRTLGFTDQGILDSFSPISALNLATNISSRSFIDISAFACVSALTVVLLATHSDFFGRKFKLNQLGTMKDVYDDVKFCGGILLRTCTITSCNCFSIQPEPGTKSGSGLFVAHSLFNHSCGPNTFRHFDGLTMITRAMEPILPGEQLFTGYGADYSYMARPQRKKKLLEEYYFDCQCLPCIEDWPTYSEILKNHIGSISKNKKLVEQLKPYKERLLIDKYDVDAVKQVLNILHGNVEKPCEEILHAIYYLRSYYLDP